MSRTSRRAIALAVFATAVLVTGVVLVPRIGGLFAGSTGIHDAAALPEHISICGRGWSKDVLERKLSLAAIRTRDGIEPVVVDPGPFAPCPGGPCTTVAQSAPCRTVIYVRVGEDSYIDYALQGGP